MRSIGPRPPAGLNIDEDRIELRPHQPWLKQQPERCARIRYVNGGDASVGEIFLRKVQWAVVYITHNLVSGNRLSVGEDRNRSVFRAARLGQVGNQLFVILGSPTLQFCVVLVSSGEQFFNAKPLLTPIRPELP